MTYSSSVIDLPPPILFKYRQFDRGIDGGAPYTRDRDIIEGNALWAGPPTNFNDPFDCVPSIDLTGSFAERKALAKRVTSRRYSAQSRAFRRREFAEAAKAIKRSFRFTPEQGLKAWTDMLPNLGVVCLAERPDDMLMWGYYADSHRGYCLGLRTAAGPLVNAHRVSYDERRPVFRPLDPNRAGLMERTLLRKADFWKHEREWRVVTKPVGRMSLEPNDLDTVVMRANINPADEQALRDMLGRRQTMPRIARAVLDPHTFRLSLIKA